MTRYDWQRPKRKRRWWQDLPSWLEWLSGFAVAGLILGATFFVYRLVMESFR